MAAVCRITQRWWRRHSPLCDSLQASTLPHRPCCCAYSSLQSLKVFSHTLLSELGSCVKVEVNVLGSNPVPNSPYGLCGREIKLNLNHTMHSELKRCVKVEVDVLGSIPVPDSPYGLCGPKVTLNRTDEGRGGRPGLSVPNHPYGLCNIELNRVRA